MTREATGGREAIVVDPVRCIGNGACAELVPERIAIDEWGFPVVDPTPVEGTLLRETRRAQNACPALALLTRTVAG